jgi:hypothetical protein
MVGLVCGAVFATGALATLVPSGIELVANGTFDTDLNGWGTSEAAWTSDDAGGSPTSGSASLVDGNSGGAVIWQRTAPGSMVPGKSYRFSFDARNTSTGGFFYYPWIRAEDATDTPTPSDFIYDGNTVPNVSFYYLPDGNYTILTPEWVHYEVDIVAGPNADKLRIQWTPGGETRESRVDNISLQELIPEPMTGMLFLLGGLAIAFRRRTV